MRSWRTRNERRRTSDEIEALVMQAIAEANAPISAYDIAHATSRAGSPLVPNQVYRTLARLIGQGHVQRIESLNAYLRRDGAADACLICDDCHHVRMIAMPDLRSCVGDVAGGTGFALERRVIELHGHCADCLARTGPSHPPSSEPNKAHHVQR